MFKKHQRKLIPLCIAVIIGILWNVFLKPQLEITARKEILKFLNTRDEFKANFKELNLNLVFGKASVDLLQVQILEPNIRKYVESVELDSLEVHLDLFKLAIGQFGISYISLNHPIVKLELDPIIDAPATAPKVLPTTEVFAQLEKLPLNAIEINSAQLLLHSKKYKFSVNIPSSDFILSKRKNLLDFQSKVTDLSLHTEDLQSPPIQISLHTVVTPDLAEIKTLEVQGAFLATTASGKILDLKNILFFPKSHIELQSQFDFDVLSKSLPLMPAFEQIKKLKGQVTVQGQATLVEKNRIQGRFDLAGNKLAFAQFTVGDIRALGQLKNDRVEVSQLQLTQSAAKVTVSKLQLKLDAPFEYSASVKVKDLDTEKLFAAINLKKIPVFASAEGELKCEGQLSSILLTCQVDGQVAELQVAGSIEEKNKPIVAINSGQVAGTINLTTNSFDYKAQVRVGKSEGKSSGHIDFHEGFSIDVISDKTVLSDLGLIANLSLHGEAQLTSQIKGNAKTATFQIHTNIKDFEFEKYKFGDLTGLINYDKGQMFFRHLRGKKTNSAYQGDLKINLLQKAISGHVAFPTVDLYDLQDLISEKLPMPTDFHGTGPLDIRFEGPLDIWKMDTYAKGTFQKITIGGETFDRLDLLVQGTQGTISFEKFVLKKNQSQIVATGKVLSTQEYQILVDGNQLKLEESALISKFNSSVFGTLSFATKISGQISNPLVDIRGAITDTVIDDQELLPSRFNMVLDRDRFSSNFEMFGQKVAGELQIPLTQNINNPFKIKLKMNKWAYGDLFAIMGNPLLQSDYQTLISGQINLVTAPDQNRMNYAQTDGIISIDRFLLQRGNQLLENDRILNIELNSGNVKIKHFELKSSDQQYFLLPPQQFSLSNLDMNFQSELNLHLLHIFLPYLEDLSGKLTLRGKVAGTYLRPELFGEANLMDGFVKLKGLSHPIERVQSKIEFSQTKMIIQQIKGQFAEGNVTGSGFVQIMNAGSTPDQRTSLIPVQLQINVADMKLNVPDQIKTQGDAALTISGQTMPYLLSGDYVVKSGLVEKDFTQGQNTEDVKRNFYLPQQIIKKESDPLNFDIQILMDQGVIVKNPMMDGSFRGRLNLKGSPQSPVLFGKIIFDKSSQIIFRDKAFTLQNGSVDFSNPNEISPDIYVAAFTRIAEYDVNLVAQGAAKDLNIKMTSVPPLSEPDLISLLALGITSSKLEAQGSSASQAQQTGYELGAAIFSQNPLNQKLKKRLGVNLQLSSSYDSTKNASVPKLTATRKLTEKINASVSQTGGTDENSTEMKLQYLINQNVSAIGSFENKEESTNSGLSTREKEQKSVIGLDIEYKREFK